jgi:hypothetical protein
MALAASPNTQGQSQVLSPSQVPVHSPSSLGTRQAMITCPSPIQAAHICLRTGKGADLSGEAGVTSSDGGTEHGSDLASVNRGGSWDVLVCAVLRMEPRAHCLLCKCSVTELHY